MSDKFIRSFAAALLYLAYGNAYQYQVSNWRFWFCIILASVILDIYVRIAKKAER